jgi:PadR family transcriptional regulator AphA
MAKSSKSQFAILGMLAILKKSSGYDLKKHMESSTQYFWKETFSSIYPVLEELEEQELIVKIEKKAKNNRKRNDYALTSKGETVLKNWLIQPAESMQIRNELMLKLFFGNMVPVEVTIEHLEKQKKELKNKLSVYQEIKHELSDMAASESLYSLLTLDHGIRQVLSSLEWCDNAIKILKSAKK